MKKQKDPTVAVKLAAQYGYKFTPEEFGQQIKQMQKVQEGQLSEEELETVAGGVSFMTPGLRDALKANPLLGVFLA